MLCVRCTSITNVANNFQKRGIIPCSQGKIRILNRRALESAVCQCYGTLKHNSAAMRASLRDGAIQTGAIFGWAGAISQKRQIDQFD